jgi:hypothetical protein
MRTWKSPVTYNEAGYIYDANGAIICHSSGGHAEAIVEALNSLASEFSGKETREAHLWTAVNVGLYDTVYQYKNCGDTHVEQIDNPSRGAPPKTGCKDSCCVKCGDPFKPGDTLQAFLRSPEDKKGSWTRPISVDAEFQARHRRNNDEVTRAHVQCLRELSSQPEE